ncbi:YeeE/YedE family protein [Sulfitobacter sp. M57]|uniref:YeeE/YedE family protein n=1 Tax=unclassified Sulfitobacter TaxID=196795 RepID=UPI0023E265D5|nr:MULTISPECIES: YeeE/YedE family protein [unclassified Sulfitobacter]MDF3414083.1 YeeE/YedE family protein [Sulfitobacter sp. KE5]MDF3420636.1 YeeE/YedE family protein [Sulfitobacter sp. KE43]MDF3432629.1 YeeE/YedE family protein [Sulfitobacter sp. KE42]MDF3458268.1 YeeE/YedE family protein [Sulfitobacter sp. S74]MDF3462169.1 YeeE/YedE family protein [Sulfitobacter sp. Ks18]
MFETFEFETLTAPQASVYFALIIGALFGILAQITKFCFRRALVGEDRRAAAGVWFTALATALLGTQAAVSAGWITFDDHRFMISDMPVLAIAIGGLMFGAGMVLTRGCVSRLTVLSGSGNLRAAVVLLVFAVVAHMTLKGVLVPLRTTLGAVTVNMGEYVTLAALPGGALLWTGILALAALSLAIRSGNGVGMLVLAALIGLLVPAAWVGTGFVLFDDFDPIAMQSLSFTSPAADTLFWGIASTSIAPGFGTGLVGGVLLGALAASLIFGGFQWQSFESPRQTGRYVSGAALMGVGGVLAGGCTLGAGLSGVPTLSVAALLAIAMIALGAKAAQAILNQGGVSTAAPSTTRQPQPAA